MRIKQIDKIMSLFAEMGGYIAISREQIAALIDDKGVDCAKLTIKRLQDHIKWMNKIRTYRK